jgi:anti-sigma factor RsiW
MNCEWTKDNLIACIDRELDPSQELILKEHLSGCIACRLEYEKIQKAWNTLDYWEDVVPPGHIQKNILGKIKRRQDATWLSVIFPAAAVLMIIAGISFFYKTYDAMNNPQLSVEDERAAAQLQNEITQENEEDIVSNLQILREKDFFDSLDKLEKIDYLPLVEDRQKESERNQRSALELIAA